MSARKKKLSDSEGL